MSIEILDGKFMMNDHLLEYRRVCKEWQQRALLPEGKVHEHHVIPRSLGGSEEETNKVVVSVPEHTFLHFLLTRCTVGDAYEKMKYAYWCMTSNEAREERESRKRQKAWKEKRQEPHRLARAAKLATNTAREEWLRSIPDFRALRGIDGPKQGPHKRGCTPESRNQKCWCQKQLCRSVRNRLEEEAARAWAKIAQREQELPRPNSNLPRLIKKVS